MISNTQSCISCATIKNAKEKTRVSGTETRPPLQDSCLLNKRAASPYRHVVRVHVVERVHMAVHMEQVTLHHTLRRAHAAAAASPARSRPPFYAPQVRRSNRPCIPRSSRSGYALSHLRANTTCCSSPSHTHTRAHFLLLLLQQSQQRRRRQLLLLWEPQRSAGQLPRFSRSEKTPQQTMWAGCVFSGGS